jgi:hypothetical protein
VALVTGTSTLRLTLEPVEALSSGPCGVRGEATRLIPLRLGQGGNLAVRLTTASALTPTLSLRTTCDDPRTAVPDSCVVAPATSGAAVLVARGLAPGNIFLEVNALEPGAGAVEVELWLDDAPSTCAAYRSFPLDAAALQVGVLNGGGLRARRFGRPGVARDFDRSGVHPRGAELRGQRPECRA